MSTYDAFKVDHINARAAFDRHSDGDTVIYTLEELCIRAGFDRDAAEFISEWYPELIHAAAEHEYYDITFGTFVQCKTYDEALEIVHDYGYENPVDFENNCGFFIVDAAFTGVIVIAD